jgi:hypothetical protein
MAYNTSKGPRDFGDLKNEDDIDTQIDWDNDKITFKTDDTTRFVIDNSAISASGNATFVGATVVGSTLNVSGATTLAGDATFTHLSGSGNLQAVGNTFLGGNLNVSGTVTFAATSTFDTAIAVSKDIDAEFVALKVVNESDAADTTGAVSIQFDLEDSSGTAVDAGKIKVKKEQGYTSDPPTQDSSLVFATSLNGTLTDYMILDSQGTLTLEGEIIGKNNATFGETGESDYFTVKSTGNALMFRVDGANDKVGIGQNPTHTLTVAGAISGSSTLEAVGNAFLGGTLNVSGAATFASSITGGVGNFTTLTATGLTLQNGGIASAGSITGVSALTTTANVDIGNYDIRALSFTSDVATGTAPFVVSSTTKVANLNADTLDGNDWASPAALGITTPAAVSATSFSGSSTLDVVGNTALGGNLNVSGTLEFKDPATLLDDTGTGEIGKFGLGTLTTGKLYYLHTNSTWTEVDANAVATGADQLLGIALGSSPTTNGLLLKGYFDATTYLSNFSAGKAVYISATAASMDTTAPSTSGDFVRVVGYCINTANVMYFNPSGDWVEL